MAKGFKHGAGGGVSGGYPEFTYTGDYEFLKEEDKNWKLRLLTSGTLTFQKLKTGLDVFLVGGGGAGGWYADTWNNNYSSGTGGGGGYTTTRRGIAAEVGVAYEIVVGAGGICENTWAPNNSGGETSAFNTSAEGGTAGDANPNSKQCGSGGSGGGGTGGNGGSDGSDGTLISSNGGIGQGTTTREFGEETGALYAGGGGGANGAGGEGGGGNGDGYNGASHATDGADNLGGGGGGSQSAASGGNGGSGIVIIRNTRGAS